MIPCTACTNDTLVKDIQELKAKNLEISNKFDAFVNAILNKTKMTSEYRQVQFEVTQATLGCGCRGGSSPQIRNLYGVLLEACATVGINTEGITDVINKMDKENW
jgi:hypothetical protein